jgi:hypothetical protein
MTTHTLKNVTMAQAALQHMSQADQAAKKNGGAK